MAVSGHGWKWARATVAAGLLLCVLAPAQLSATERFVQGWHTGLALHGFDPVAYFTDAEPKMGRPDNEVAHAGTVWRFRNEGNRAAFLERPDIYMPRFGGYDPLAVARGAAAPGHPRLWFIFRNSLYLFQNADSLNAFTANPDRALAAAETRWPDVYRGLTP